MANKDIYEDISYLENNLELAEYIKGSLLARATNGDFDTRNYKEIRQKFLADENMKKFLPDYIRKCRDLEQFWQFIKVEYSGDGCYSKRKNYIYPLALVKNHLKNVLHKNFQFLLVLFFYFQKYIHEYFDC